MTLTYKRNLEFRDSDDERSWMRIACADVKQGVHLMTHNVRSFWINDRCTECQRWQIIRIYDMCVGVRPNLVRTNSSSPKSQKSRIPTCTTLLRAAPASFTNFFTLKSILASEFYTIENASLRSCQWTNLSLSLPPPLIYIYFYFVRFIFNRSLMSRVSAEWRHIVACAHRHVRF